MVKHGKKWPKMAKSANMAKWSKMTKVVRNGQKQSNMVKK